MTDDPRAAAFEQALTDEVLHESRVACNRESPYGASEGWEAMRAVLVAALLKAAPDAEGPTWQQGREQEYERWRLWVGGYLAIHGVNLPSFPRPCPPHPATRPGRSKR
jgi:hypothetical protein